VIAAIKLHSRVREGRPDCPMVTDILSGLVLLQEAFCTKKLHVYAVQRGKGYIIYVVFGSHVE